MTCLQQQKKWAADLHCQPTTWPGAHRLHVWLYRHDSGDWARANEI